jgi:transcriptional regulator with XRE-family HTH domain
MTLSSYFLTIFIIFCKILIMNKNERVRNIIEDLNLSDSEFANRIGFKRQVISQWKQNDISISDKAIIAIITVFKQYDALWIATGEGNMYKSASDTRQNYVITPDTFDVLKDKEENYTGIVEAMREEIKALKEVIKTKDELIQVLRKK